MAVVTFTAVPGTTYRVAVDGYDGSVGNITIGVTDEGGGGAVLPTNAVGIADFVNGGYKWMTTDLVASDVTDHPELITPSTGLITNDVANTTVPRFINDFETYLLAADWTVVLEWYRNGTFAEPLRIQNSAATSPGSNPVFQIEDDHNYALFSDYLASFAGERDLTPTHVGGSGVTNVLAITRTDAKLVASFNGAAIVSNGAALAGFAAGVDRAFIGGEAGYAYDQMTLRRIVIYPPQADADLPGLSVLS